MPWITIVSVVLLAYALVDVIATDNQLIRYIPKLVWLIVVLAVPVLGPLTWIVLGRPRGASLLPGTTVAEAPRTTAQRRPLAPDDDPEFLRRLNDPRDER